MNKKNLPSDFESDGGHDLLEEEDLEDHTAKQSSKKLLPKSSKASHAVATSGGHGGHHEVGCIESLVIENLLTFPMFRLK
ncbi:hypothetical protein EON65_05320 [archaeon]|nr:MAG: hypothetical protein EON65_05320 [archaeon]